MKYFGFDEQALGPTPIHNLLPWENRFNVQETYQQMKSECTAPTAHLPHCFSVAPRSPAWVWNCRICEVELESDPGHVALFDKMYVQLGHGEDTDDATETPL